MDEKTVGQFTGLKDKEKKEIFEGDISEYIYCPQSLNQKITGVIKTDKHGRFVVNDAKCLYHIEHAVIGKIIGNIHDNQNLLTEKRTRNEND